MKTIYKIFAASAITLLSLAACSKEDSYEPGEPEVDGCYGVYFPSQEASGSHTYNPTADKSITVTVARSNSNGAITVPVEVTSNVQGVFNVAPITFADGQSETTTEITFPNIEEGVSSTVSLTITDNQYASKYNEGDISIDITILSVAYQDFLDPTTGQPADVTFTVLNFFQADLGTVDSDVDYYTVHGNIIYYEVNGIRYCTVKTSDADKGIFGTGLELQFRWYTGITYPDAGSQAIEVPSQYALGDVAIDDSGATYPVYVKDYYHYALDVGNDFGTFSDFVNNYSGKYPLSYYDGNGGFYFKLIGTIEGTNYWYGFNADAAVGVASGFVRTDYSIELSTDLATDGQLPVYLTLGTDVDEVRYGVYEGSLTAGQIENRISEISGGGQTGSYTVDENSGFTLSLDATGVYTIVALSYANGAYQGEYASASFNYVSAADAGTYAPVISVGTEDVSARYGSQGYDKTNSFGFYIVGSGLTEVHATAVTTARYTGNEETYNEAIKSSSNYTLSADELAAVNAAGGYADIITGLSANTSYTLLVYASNGQQETWVTSEYTTDGLPNEVVVDGTGAFLYTQWWEGLDEGYSLEYNPNTKEYEIPEWGGGVTLHFTVNEDNTITIPYQPIGYTHSSYGTVYAVGSCDIDTVFGEGVGEQYEFNQTKSYIDADGNYNFILAYFVSDGWFSKGDDENPEIFYPAGAPAEEAAASAQSVNVSKASLHKAKAAVKLASSEPRIAGVDYKFSTVKAANVKVSALTSHRRVNLAKDNSSFVR